MFVPCCHKDIVKHRFITNMEKKESRPVKLKTKLIFIYLIIFGFRFSQAAKRTYEEISGAVFQFPEFSYEHNRKNEVAYRKNETSCEQNVDCEVLKGLKRLNCISPSCYHHINEFDELEEIEIDVRLNSSKVASSIKTIV